MIETRIIDRIIKDAEYAEREYDRDAEYARRNKRHIVPNWVLTDHLNTARTAHKYRPGLHDVVITVTKTPVLGLIPREWEYMEGLIIKVAGSKYREP